MPRGELQEPFSLEPVLYALSFLIIIDLLAILAILLLSRMRKKESNVLYDGEEITLELIAQTSMFDGRKL
jgi:hypothetical protein